MEQGVLMNIGNVTKRVFGTVNILTADNLPSHAVGGMKIGFSRAYRIVKVPLNCGN